MTNWSCVVADISKVVIYGQRPSSPSDQRDGPTDDYDDDDDDDDDLFLASSGINGGPKDEAVAPPFEISSSSAYSPSLHYHHQLTHLDRKFLAAVGRSPALDELTIENNRLKVGLLSFLRHVIWWNGG